MNEESYEEHHVPGRVGQEVGAELDTRDSVFVESSLIISELIGSIVTDNDDNDLEGVLEDYDQHGVEDDDEPEDSCGPRIGQQSPAEQEAGIDERKHAAIEDDDDNDKEVHHVL